MMLSKLQFLKVLILKGCRTLKETVPYASIATRFGFPSLEVLDVRDTPISDCDIQCFSLVKTLKEVLMECPGEFVKKSQLSQTPIIDDGIGSGSFSGIGNGCASGSGIGNGSGSGCQSGIGIGSGSSSGCSTSSNSNTNKTVEVNYDSEDSVFNVSDDDDKDDKDDNAGNEKLADRGKNYHENIYNISYNPEENRIVHIFVRSTEYDPAIFLPHENRAGRVPQTVYAQILPENREISFFRHSRLIPGPQQEPIECRGDVDDSEDSEEDEDEDDEFEIFPPIPTGVPRPAPALSPQEYIHASSFRLEAPQPTYVGDRGICSFGHSKANGDMILIRADNELPKFTSSIQKLLIRHYKNVTDLSLRHLIECAPDLQYIDVTGTSVTADGVQLFKNVKPLCTVLSNFD